VSEVVTPLLARRGLATCVLVDLEVLYSARSPAEYQTKLTELRHGYVNLPITPMICARAIDVQSKLAVRSQHRGCGGTDLLIAACAEVHGIPVLHYDRDFDLIASVTGQPVKWVVPRGSVP
jgi:predicted nucleic acid-binding protein